MVRRILVIVTAVALTACSSLPVSRTYVGEADKGTTLLAPAGWTVFSAEEMLGPEAEGPPYLVGFAEGAADPSEPMAGPTPGGVLTVTLHTSLEAARAAAEDAFLLDLDAMVEAGKATVLDVSDPVLVGAFEHRRWIVEAEVRPGTVVRVLQEVATSTRPSARADDGTALYANKSLIVGCLLECFEERNDVILDVYRSWEVI